MQSPEQVQARVLELHEKLERGEQLDENEELELRAALVAKISEHRLTPDELDGSSYRLTLGRVLYIGIGVTLIAFCLTVYFIGLAEGISAANAIIIAVLMYLVLAPIALNLREAICEHIVGSWCSKRGIPAIGWINEREALAPQLSPLARWAARHLPESRRLS